jgi:perosamine synthetase
MIPFFVPEFTKDMENAAIDALRNEKFVMGESVAKFEEEFARYIGTKYAISVNSGNSALQLSLLSLNIAEESKVITSTNSFIASANCILMTGSKPILCDINYDDGNMDIKSTNEKPDAIIPVHIYGNPCDLESIKNVSETYKVPIIEDACQAHGAVYEQKKVGSLGDVGCFSFYPTKNMTVCGDGGMVTTNN